MPTAKQCPRCGRTLPPEAFDRRAGRTTLESHCRECKRAAARDRRAAKRAATPQPEAAHSAALPEPHLAKECASCHEVKAPNAFYLVKRRPGAYDVPGHTPARYRLSSWCRRCTRLSAAESKANAR